MSGDGHEQRLYDQGRLRKRTRDRRIDGRADLCRPGRGDRQPGAARKRRRRHRRQPPDTRRAVQHHHQRQFRRRGAEDAHRRSAGDEKPPDRNGRETRHRAVRHARSEISPRPVGIRSRSRKSGCAEHARRGHTVAQTTDHLRCERSRRLRRTRPEPRPRRPVALRDAGKRPGRGQPRRHRRRRAHGAGPERRRSGRQGDGAARQSQHLGLRRPGDHEGQHRRWQTPRHPRERSRPERLRGAARTDQRRRRGHLHPQRNASGALLSGFQEVQPLRRQLR